MMHLFMTYDIIQHMTHCLQILEKHDLINGNVAQSGVGQLATNWVKILRNGTNRDFSDRISIHFAPCPILGQIDLSYEPTEASGPCKHMQTLQI